MLSVSIALRRVGLPRQLSTKTLAPTASTTTYGSKCTFPSEQRRFLHLSPREADHLQLHNAGRLAQYRLARGVRLNYPEAVALITMQMMEKIRDGKKVSVCVHDVRNFRVSSCS